MHVLRDSTYIEFRYFSWILLGLEISISALASFDPMFRFQLEVAIALVTSAFSSLGRSIFTGKKAEGTIQLPVHVEEDQHDTLHDPFDVTKPEDVVHGYPIDAEGFWTRVCVSIIP
jgi:hypothetical protein